MTTTKSVKTILAVLIALFGMFVLGYHVGKHLAKAENASESARTSPLSQADYSPSRPASVITQPGTVGSPA